MSRGVWDLLDPGKSVSDKPSLTKPVRPTAGQIRAEAISVADLTQPEYTKYERLSREYDQDMKEYDRQVKSLNAVGDCVQDTIGKYTSVIANEKNGLAAELLVLKNRLKPTDWAEEEETRIKYYEVLNSVKRLKFEEWIQQWQVIIQE